MIDPTTAAVIAIIFLAALVKGVAGFGDALVALPLLALVLDLRIATPAFAFCTIVTTLVVLWHERHHVHFGATWRLWIATATGLPVGIYLLAVANQAYLKLLLAGLVLGFAVWKFLGDPKARFETDRPAWFFGLSSGIFGGAFNITGPPVIAFGLLRGWTKERMRGTLQGYFIVTNILIMIGHGTAGLWTLETFRLFALCLPSIALANALALVISRRLAPEKFERVVIALLAASGCTLLIESIRAVAA